VWTFFWWILFGLLLLAAFGLGLLLWLWAWLLYRSTELAVTNKRIIVKSGLIQRTPPRCFSKKSKAFRSTRNTRTHLDFGSITISHRR